MYKQQKRVLAGITGQFTECEQEQAHAYCVQSSSTSTDRIFFYLKQKETLEWNNGKSWLFPSFQHNKTVAPDPTVKCQRASSVPQSSSLHTPPLLLLSPAESQSSSLISTMLSMAGVSELFSGILITPQGVIWPPMQVTQQEMSSGREPPTVATESGKLLSPQREEKVRMWD